MSHYKHKNGRIVPRGKNGRFQKATLQNTFGITANGERLICGKCGHGKKEMFFPVLADGECPKCDNQEGHIPLKQYLDGLVGLDLWYITDFWEEFHAVPVKVKEISATRKITLIMELEAGETQEYVVDDATELYTDRAEAGKEATRRNTQAIADKSDKF